MKFEQKYSPRATLPLFPTVCFCVVFTGLLIQQSQNHSAPQNARSLAADLHHQRAQGSTNWNVSCWDFSPLYERRCGHRLREVHFVVTDAVFR